MVGIRAVAREGARARHQSGSSLADGGVLDDRVRFLGLRTHHYGARALSRGVVAFVDATLHFMPDDRPREKVALRGGGL